MCPPKYFAVSYAINPWMHPDRPADVALAMTQWAGLCATFARLGHRVHIIDPVPGLPDMVFAANGATVIDGKVLGARFRHAERAAEAAVYLDWFRRHGYPVVHTAEAVNEGEGDIVPAGGVVLAGYGLRTSEAAVAEIEELFGPKCCALELRTEREESP